MKQLVALMLLTAAICFAGNGWASVGCRRITPYYGVNQDFVWTDIDDYDLLIRAMKEAGIQAVRMPMRWTALEKTKGKWDFTKVDKAVKTLRDADLAILPILMSVPAWAHGRTEAELKGGFPDSFVPQNLSDWENYVAKCVQRYKKDIRFWEIWNEQNGADFYRPMPDSGEYVKLLRTAYTSIKKNDPDAVVVMGGLQMNGIVPNPWSAVKIENFLQKTYDAGGKPYFDIVNIHPYVLEAPREGPDYLAKLVTDTIQVMQNNGDGKKPIWITEIGLSTSAQVSESKQAEHLRGVFETLKKFPQVKAVYWFTLRDYPSSVCGGEDTMGLLGVDGRRKPSFEAYRQAATNQRQKE